MNDTRRPDPDPADQPHDPLEHLYEEVVAKTPGSPTTGDPTQIEPEELAEPPPIPIAFGRYVVKRHIGSGGFGSVYLAHDGQLDRPVAVKAFPSVVSQPEKVQAFMGEARRVARLRHPGIVSVHDVGVEDVWVYIVSDFLEGPDLGGWLALNRPAWPEAVRITAALADALAHAHSKRTIHRDVKPGNILITSGDSPVLVDFGISLDEGTNSGTELGVIIGTPKYMSPEQVAGEAHRIDGRTDIYSLGVVLYEMLCGRTPFDSKDLSELLRQVAADAPQPLRQLVPGLPAELEKVCLKALSKSQDDRYTTAADFAQDLRRVAETSPKPPTTRTGTTGISADRPTRKPTTTRPREAERRQVTVLMTTFDAFDSKQFQEDLEAEEQSEVIDVCRRACEKAVREAGGTVVQFNPQGLLACFGYPVAQEDAARRAVSAALAIRQEVHPFSDDLKMPFPTRSAIHTGAAVVQSGDDVVSVVGEARNLAIRLHELVPAGRVVCSEMTHRLVSRYFACTSLDRHPVKGQDAPIEIFAIEAPRPTQNPIDAAVPGGLSPLTGRDHELSLLRDRWEQAQEEMGQVVLLIGEPGLGKSRLVHAIRQHVQEQKTPESFVIEWRCSPQFTNSELYPARDYLERLLGFEADTPAAERYDRLVTHLDNIALGRKEALPCMASLLCLPPDDRYPAPSLSPAREREESFRALREWLKACADCGPILFVVEDLHWIDATTLEFLGLFLAEGLRDRILTILTFRPEFRTPWPALAHQTSLALNRLTRRQVGDLMRGKTGVAQLTDAMIARMHDRTGGVPLFIEEFTRLVQVSGELPREIPGTLQDLVMARLELMTGERDLVQLASVLGREFSHELVAAVADLDEATLQAELLKLVEAELLYPKGRPPKGSYLFKHALLQDAAYASLVKVKRQDHHRRVADVLESRFPLLVEAQPELLAHHLTEAGVVDRATEAWFKAGMKSLARWAHAEAIGHFQRGLTLLRGLEQSPERDGQEMKFLKPLGMATMAASGYASPEAGAVMTRARELSERIGHPVQLFAVMWGVWAWHVVRAEYPLCMTLWEEALTFSGKLQDPGIRMEALFMPALTLFSRGDFPGATAHLTDALAHYDDRARTRHWADITGQDSGIAHRCYHALSLWHLGRPDQALKAMKEAVDLARTVDHPYSLAYVQHHAGWFYYNLRMPEEAMAAAVEEAKLAADHGFELLIATSMMYKAAALLLRGPTEAALPLLRDGIARYRASGAEMALPFYYSIQTRATLGLGRFKEARAALADAFGMVEKNDDRFRESDLHHLQAELILAESRDGNQAEPHLLKAREVARRQGSRALELKCTLSLARLWKGQGRTKEALEALKAVYSQYTEGFATADLADAARLIAELGKT